MFARINKQALASTQTPSAQLKEDVNAVLAPVTSGIHHITAFASDPARNLDFYTRVLGLRLLKKTINFDDPGTYHFYFGDTSGSPGSALTFFPIPGLPRAAQGSGSVTATAFSVPHGALPAWSERLTKLGVRVHNQEVRFDQSVLRFEDHDGTQLELIETAGIEALPAWTGGGVDASMAIRGFHSATISLRHTEHTARLLTDHFGMKVTQNDGQRTRFTSAGVAGTGLVSGIGRIVDLLHTPGLALARGGVGTVHHIAMRAADESQQHAFASRLEASGFGVTAVRDRYYFKSIYFRERGGVLFEIATDGPGFATDESPEALGSGLMLPPMYEPQRRQIVSSLPPLGVDRNPLASQNSTRPDADAYTHLFIPAKAEHSGRWLLLLHGTGGDEHDLVPLGEKLLPGAAMLSPRGDISESGHLRFFKRFAEGVFDLEDVARASEKLAGWIVAAAARYKLDPAKGIAVGFSNGANLAAASLLTRGPVIGRAVLIRAMQTLTPAPGVSLGGMPVLVLSGTADQIVPLSNGRGLAAQLHAAGALVRHVEIPVGHTLAPGDLSAARSFING